MPNGRDNQQIKIGNIVLGFSKSDSHRAKMLEFSNYSDEIFIIQGEEKNFNKNILGVLSKYDKVNIFIYVHATIPNNKKEIIISFFNNENTISNIGLIERVICVYERNGLASCIEILEKIDQSFKKSVNIILLDFKQYKDYNQIRLATVSDLPFLQLYYDMEAISVKGLEITDRGYVPNELIKCIDQNGYIEEKYWYIDEQSAALWQNLTNPSSGYLLTKNSIEVLSENIKTIVPEIIRTSQLPPNKFIDLISLGVGTPQKDEEILHHLITSAMDIRRKKSTNIFINYYPVDISNPFLAYTLRYLFQVLPIHTGISKVTFKKVMNMYPLLGDFELIGTQSYRSILKEGNNIKLVILLGNTIGNLPEEDEFFEKLADLIYPDGYLLIDAEFSNSSTDEQLISQYMNEAVFNFVKHPLEISSEHVENIKLPKELKIENFEVEVIDTTASFNFGKGGRAKKIALTRIPDSRVVALYYNIEEDQKVLLAWSTKYKKEQFEKYILNQFIIVGKPYSRGNVGLYLLQNKNGKKK